MLILIPALGKCLPRNRERNEGSRSEWPPWLHRYRDERSVSRKWNQVKPSSHRGRKPIKDFEMQRNRPGTSDQTEGRTDRQLQPFFFVSAFEWFSVFYLKKKIVSVKQSKTSRQELSWLRWNKALLLLCSWLGVVSLPSTQAKPSLHLAGGSSCPAWTSDRLRDSWDYIYQGSSKESEELIPA